MGFCHPCDFKENEIAAVQFNVIEGEIAETAFWEMNPDMKMDITSVDSEKGRYICNGRITGINPVMVDCGIIEFSLGDWINDESVKGKYVYFVIARLDIDRDYQDK